MEPGEKIRIRREEKSLSQADLGRKVGVSQAAIMKIESGETKQSKYMPRIAMVLDLDPADLDPALRALPASADAVIPKRQLIGEERDFPVYSAVQGGPGEILRSPDPVDWHPRPQQVAHVKDAYGLYVVGDSMVPEWKPGEVVIVNPHLPLIGGESYIFYAEKDGEARATIKELRRANAELWFVSQHNPPKGAEKDFTLPRREWRWAHRVVGKQGRS